MITINGKTCCKLAAAPAGFSTFTLNKEGEKQWFTFTRNDRSAEKTLIVEGHSLVLGGCWSDANDEESMHNPGGYYGCYYLA
jgi:hypothetical protein